jgi:hypothetical protein
VDDNKLYYLNFVFYLYTITYSAYTVRKQFSLRTLRIREYGHSGKRCFVPQHEKRLEWLGKVGLVVLGMDPSLSLRMTRGCDIMVAMALRLENN